MLPSTNALRVLTPATGLWAGATSFAITRLSGYGSIRADERRRPGVSTDTAIAVTRKWRWLYVWVNELANVDKQGDQLRKRPRAVAEFAFYDSRQLTKRLVVLAHNEVWVVAKPVCA